MRYSRGGGLTARQREFREQAVGLDELGATVRFALKRIQYRPELVDGCLAETGLIMRPP
jgi:hypothetical protein